MKPATLYQIKKELETCTHKRLVELTLQLAKYKTENKEFLSYLIFDASDNEAYIFEIREEIERMTKEINTYSFYKTQKGIRKIIRIIGKYSKYMGSKEIEAELLLFFIKSIKESKIPINKSKSLTMIYFKQIERIEKLTAFVHEDLKHDFLSEIRNLRNYIL